MRLADALLEDLAWLNRLLDAELKLFRRNVEDPYRGLYVSDEDADGALVGLPLLDLPRAYAELVHAVLARWAEHAARDSEGPLDELARRAGLSPFERGALLLCLAPEVDLRYQRLYAYLHDDITRKAPSVELAINTFCADHEARLAGAGALTPAARLQQLGLLETIAPDGGAPFLAHSIKLSERAQHYLLGGGAPAPALPTFATLVEPSPRDRHAPPLPADLEQLLTGRHPERMQIVGDDPFTRRAIAHSIARRLGANLIVVACRSLTAQTPELAQGLRRLTCEAVLGRALVLWEALDELPEPGGSTHRSVHAYLRTGPRPQLLGTSREHVLGGGDEPVPFLVAAGAPDVEQRERIFRRALGDRANAGDGGADTADADAIDAASLAARYPLHAHQIAEAVELARSASAGANARLQMAELERACRIVGEPELDGLADRVEATYDFEDLILPADKLAALHDICTHARYRALTTARWRIARKSESGAGLSVLFAGPPGTGKTMACGVIARALGLSLYRVDLARLVSKYIGETEKNIAQVFDAARRSAACLLFDEADAIFAKRSEVKDSHDRFANLETSYLLQRLEHHDGIAFLSTNFRHNIDSAFTRRLSFIIRITPPDEPARLELWKRAWPAERGGPRILDQLLR